jgi:hypothetical protein
MQKMMYLLVSQNVSGMIFGHHHAHHQENGTKPTTPMVYSTGRDAVDSWRRGGSVCTCWDWFHHSPDDGHDDARNMLRHQ